MRQVDMAGPSTAPHSLHTTLEARLSGTEWDMRGDNVEQAQVNPRSTAAAAQRARLVGGRCHIARTLVYCVCVEREWRCPISCQHPILSASTKRSVCRVGVWCAGVRLCGEIVRINRVCGCVGVWVCGWVGRAAAAQPIHPTSTAHRNSQHHWTLSSFRPSLHCTPLELHVDHWQLVSSPHTHSSSSSP